MPRKIILNISDPDTINYTVKQIETLIENLRNPKPAVMNKLLTIIENDYVAPTMKKLKRIPPRRKYPSQYPLEFTSEKQQRYVMGVVLRDQKPYRRTGRLTRGWNYSTKISRNKIKINIENKYKNSQYVVGLLGLGKSSSSVRRYTRPMQKFHKVTGWQPAYKKILELSDSIQKNADIILKTWLES